MMPIYLDYNATTPVDPAVLDVMLPYLRAQYGNPSSTHAFGKAAHDAVEQARRQVAELIGAQPSEIVFTGGGSEASNQAIKGTAFPLLARGGVRGWRGEGVKGSARCIRDFAPSPPHPHTPSPQTIWSRLTSYFRVRRSIHLVTSAVEHPATLRPLAFLQELGCEVTVLPVDRLGVVDLDAYLQALKRSPLLISIMHSNNEVGTLQPIQEMARLAHERGALFHTDAAQSIGKLAVNVRELGVDLLSIAGHKVYAPKGVGVLYVRDGLTLEPLIHGAGHESGRRAGTENVPYIVALGAACAIAQLSLSSSPPCEGGGGGGGAAILRLRFLRDRLWRHLRTSLGDDIVLNGHPEARLPNTLNVNFRGWIGAELLAACPEVAASTGSACHEGHVTLSPVLQAMGVSLELGRGAVRLSVGRFTIEEEVDRAAAALIAAARSATRPLAPRIVTP